MAYLAKARKEDLRTLAVELGLQINDAMKVIELKDIITKPPRYDEPFTKNLLETIVETRVQQETERKYAEEQKNNEQALLHEIERLKLSAATTTSGSSVNASTSVSAEVINIQHLVPKFNESCDISSYLQIYERQCEQFNLKESVYITHLLPLLPIEISQIILREPKEKLLDYPYIKKILLQRFKLNAESFRIKLTTHQRPSGTLWKDFAYELSNFMEEWLHSLEVKDYDALKDLLLTDQIKRRVSNDVKDHFVDTWGTIKNSSELAQKLDDYEAVRGKFSNNKVQTPMKRNPQLQSSNRAKPTDRSSEASMYNKSFPHRGERQRFNNRPPLSCYGCGKSGYVKAKCPDCNPSKSSSSTFGTVRFQSSSSPTTNAVFRISVVGATGTAFADSGASHSIASDTLYRILLQQGAVFEKIKLRVSFADGLVSEKEVLRTEQHVFLEGRNFKTSLIVLPEAKNNSTLLGIDFLKMARIVLNIAEGKWYFSDTPRKFYNFVKPHLHKSANDVPVVVNSCQLRKNEGQQLTAGQRAEIDEFLTKHQTIFTVGGDPTPFIEHHINTGNHPPVSVPPYRMNQNKKDLLKKELDALLEQGIIEECESPYASPVVLVPKPDGKVRLCIDYRRLNDQTVPDTYPLPRMDDLLNEAKPTPYMSTIDLRSGYHQVKVAEEDQNKTAFICPFGTFKFTRMAFGLRNAPATFQRLIDKFRSGLNNVFVLSYLDDIIVLSPTLQKHLSDLEKVFKRLALYKLKANREKCHFCCEKVKYLGHYITKDGISVDPQKTSAIADMPSPKTVKQVQSFVQTCSWYRRYIPDFSQIAKPLTDLTKKRAAWKWDLEQENAFKELKSKLVSPPILKQADGNLPFVIRTDASDVALGAVLLQGEKDDEHPIEYASRLLTSAEQNYSTTEREALAVVWALNKFRGYVEGQSITLTSDHQPLKWLLSLKSPSGRLARWALQIQSYNITIDYLPGRSNFVADLLSRPVCEHPTIDFCQLCTTSIVIPTASPSELRKSQLEDDNLRKIIEAFENTEKDVDFATWTGRGYIMNQGVLYRYSPDAEEEEAQLVIPKQKISDVLKEYHDSPMAGHFGNEGTYHRISKRYYWVGMRKEISEYVKNCPECCRYKASNQKPSGLLQTPVYAQRFETLSIDLFGPLPETPSGEKWIFIVEDCSTKWIELFALKEATARDCATTLLEEVALRYGLPRKIISDNGPQFTSAVMQQLCYILKIDQSPTPVYHPQANPVERKNRDLKPRLAILVGNDHQAWKDKLPFIRFALNTAKCETTGHSAAFLQFARELRTLDDVTHDIKAVIEHDNFVPEITPYLKRFIKTVKQVRERVEFHQDKRKKYADKKRQSVPKFSTGDQVWVTLHPISRGQQKKTSKFMPKRDGPYVIVATHSPTTYDIADPSEPDKVLGKYHISALKPYQEKLGSSDPTTPVAPLRKRGRPPRLAQSKPVSRVRDAGKPATTTQVKARPVRSPPAAPNNQSSSPDILPGRLRSQRGRM